MTAAAIAINPKTDVYVYYGSEIMRATPEGYVYRPAIRLRPSGNWRITHATQYAGPNSSRIVRVWTWAEILADPSLIPWRNKKNEQITFVRDLDHGTVREWRNPKHEISKGSARY